MAVSVFPVPSAGNPTYAFTFTGPKLFQPNVPAGVYEVKADLPAGGLISNVASGQDIFAGTPVARASGNGTASGLVNLTGSNSLMVQDTTPGSFDDPRFVTYSGVLSGNSQRLRFLNGMLINLGDSGNFSTSTNGITWTFGSVPESQTLRDIIFDGTRYLISASNRRIFTSTNLISWQTTVVTSGIFEGWTTISFPSIAFFDGKYVVCSDGGQSSTPKIAYSTDLVSWASTMGGSMSVPTELFVYNNILIVIASSSFQNQFVWTSTNGITWTNRSQGNLTSFNSIVAGHGRVWAWGGEQPLISTDGITWSVGTVGSNGPRASTFANGELIMASNWRSIRTSTDGTTFLSRNHSLDNGSVAGCAALPSGVVVVTSLNQASRTTTNFGGINLGQTAFGSVFGGNRFVFVGASGAMSVSTNGSTWATRTSGFGTTQINSVTFGNNLYVAAGNAGVLTTSTDTVTWTARTSQFGANAIQSVIFGNGLYVAAGAGGVITTSTNGIDWTARTSGTTNILYALASSSRAFIAGGAGGAFRFSTDAITWSTRTTTFGTTEIRSATFGNGLFVIGGANGTLATSPDGASWTARTSGFPSGQTIFGLTFANGIFVAAGTSAISTSTDGITWVYDERPRLVIGNGNFNTSAAGAGKYVVAGDSGLAAIADINPSFGGTRNVVLEFKGAAVAG